MIRQCAVAHSHSRPITNRFEDWSFRMKVVSLLTTTLVLTTAFSAFGQESVASPPTPLSQLLAEAGANNPQISAADHGARAARQMSPQATTLPDPKFTYQQLSVGSPTPFARHTTTDFPSLVTA